MVLSGIKNYIDLSHDNFASKHLIMERSYEPMSIKELSILRTMNCVFSTFFLNVIFFSFYRSVVEFSDFLFCFLHGLITD